MKQKTIYLDYAATTPPAPEVVEQMTLGLTKLWGNASSEHTLGHYAHQELEDAMMSMAKFLEVPVTCLTLTSGTTESINFAIKGVMRAQNKKHLIAITTEHKATLNTTQALIKEGYQVTYLAPNDDGQITAQMFEDAITDETALITTLWVNNETGEIYDVVGISEVARRHNVLLHVDATQAMPHFKVDVTLADLVSFTAHKIYGPKGVGILYKRDFPKLPLMPVIDGAKTELGNHTGTLANHQILGLAKAVQLLSHHFTTEQVQNERRLQYLFELLAPLGVTRNGKEKMLTPAIINIHVPNVYGETLMSAVPHLCFSRGSACNSEETLPSHVLTELGYDNKHARESVRISLGRYLLAFDFKRAMKDLSVAIEQLQSIAKGERNATVLPAVYKKGRQRDLQLLEHDDFQTTHEFMLERDDITLKLWVHMESEKVTKLSIAVQATPFILSFMNEVAGMLRQQSLSVWQEFNVNKVEQYQCAPQNEMRLTMIIEKFIRDSAQAMKV